MKRNTEDYKAGLYEPSFLKEALMHECVNKRSAGRIYSALSKRGITTLDRLLTVRLIDLHGVGLGLKSYEIIDIIRSKYSDLKVLQDNTKVLISKLKYFDTIALEDVRLIVKCLSAGEGEGQNLFLPEHLYTLHKNQFNEVSIDTEVGLYLPLDSKLVYYLDSSNVELVIMGSHFECRELIF